MSKRIGRRAVGILSLLLIIVSLLPLFSRVVNVGVYLPCAIGVVGAVWGFTKPRGGHRAMIVVVVAILSVIALLTGIIIALMAHAATRQPDGTPATVVVLGAGIRDDQNPSLMLRGRLDVAVTYLQENPQAVCIVTGGQGSDEPCTEASVMARYLQAQGIDAARIRLEERATSTHENLQYSMDIIRQEGLSSHVVIATQEFHQYRAAQLARMAGAEGVSALTARSPWHLLLCYWVRECAAICRLWLTGH